MIAVSWSDWGEMTYLPDGSFTWTKRDPGSLLGMEAFLCPLSLSYFLSLYEFTLLVIFIGVLLLYSAVLVSAVKQSESVSCIYIYLFMHKNYM